MIFFLNCLPFLPLPRTLTCVCHIMLVKPKFPKIKTKKNKINKLFSNYQIFYCNYLHHRLQINIYIL
ncbi:hypothetical protein RCL_jg28837.t1 [Rhizophagus clarus]|uniref:Uncharacterized protein n=1 Tax=Rhizophagus clarus TaxID=94130 RepID=A0A8H3LUS6_9GLOM|nr:hypothetical protein RCL_jg28837.t1 [Rhizophagus clarus]